MQNQTTEQSTYQLPPPWDAEKFRLLGKHRIKMREDGMFYTTGQTAVPEEVKASMRSDREVWQDHIRFLEKGDEPPCASHYWFKNVRQVKLPYSETGRVQLDDPFLYEDSELDWSEQEMSFTSITDTVFHSVRGGQDWSAFYAYDKTLSKDEREVSPVTIFFVNWRDRTVYSHNSDMTSANREATEALVLIKTTGSVEDALVWCKAKELYHAGATEGFSIADGI